MPFVILPTNSASGGYDVTNSLRFNRGSSDSLTRTPASAGNRKTFTFSCWFKLSNIASSVSGYYQIFGGYTGTVNDGIWISDADKFYVYFDGAERRITNQVIRDVSAWYHLIFAVDTTQATASNRIKLYLNGSEITSFSTNTNPSLNYDSGVNNNTLQNIGKRISDDYFNGYMSDVYLIDGQQLTPTSFGETDEDTGIWKPKAFSGTYGTNGFYLQFKNSASLGTDSSGNGNTFTVNNLTSIDQTTDTPTNNFATWNPLFPAGGTLTFSQGNTSLSAPNDGLWKTTLSTMASQNGKWYMEFKSGGNYIIAGVCDFNVTTRGIDGDNFASKTTVSTFGYGYYNGDGSVRYTALEINPYGDTYTTGDIIGIALDCDNKKLYFSKNGTWQNSGVPTSGATGTGAVSLDSTAGRFWGFAFSIYQTNDRFANFGNPTYSANSYTDGAGYGNFSYAVPSGYYALNTKNLANLG